MTNVLLFVILATLLLTAGLVRSVISDVVDGVLLIATLIAILFMIGWASARYDESRLKVVLEKGGEWLLKAYLIAGGLFFAGVSLWVCYLWFVQKWTLWATD